jgi:acyl-CoA dehydrogenase
MGVLGGRLKFKEKLTGRYADVLMWMYFATATLRRYEAEGRPAGQEKLLQWSMEYAFTRIQEAFDGIFANFEIPILKSILRGPVGFWSRLNRISPKPSDRLGHKIARLAQVPGDFRNNLLKGLYIPKDNDPQSNLEKAFGLVIEAESILKKIRIATRNKALPKGRPARLIEKAVEAGVITAEEAALVRKAELARDEAIAVDSFAVSSYSSGLFEASDHGKVRS